MPIEGGKKKNCPLETLQDVKENKTPNSSGFEY